ncbi:hypothetical protein JS534_08180 [Bifidobacterium felsineum]|nr:hypothetical protein [Bifidobacterium felsineum]
MADIIEYDYSNLSPDRLLTHLAGLQILAKRVNMALAAAKREYLRTHDATSPKENALFDGQDAATVIVKKDGEGEYRVDDPIAYADFLAHYGIDCEGQPAVRTVNYPTENAMKPKWLERLISEHGGELPDGVSWHAGRAGGVSVTLNKGMADRPYDPARLMQVAVDSFGTPAIED